LWRSSIIWEFDYTRTYRSSVHQMHLIVIGAKCFFVGVSSVRADSCITTINCCFMCHLSLFLIRIYVYEWQLRWWGWKSSYVLINSVRERKKRSKKSKWVTHLKWTVLPNWEMKSNDAKGERREVTTTKKERERERKRK
jgi:hypothetical protein